MSKESEWGGVKSGGGVKVTKTHVEPEGPVAHPTDASSKSKWEQTLAIVKSKGGFSKTRAAGGEEERGRGKVCRGGGGGGGSKKGVVLIPSKKEWKALAQRLSLKLLRATLRKESVTPSLRRILK